MSFDKLSTIASTSQFERWEPYVRDATPEKYEQVLDVAAIAFSLDPTTLYVAGVKNEEVSSHTSVFSII